MQSAQEAGACTYSDGSLNSSVLTTQSSIFVQSVFDTSSSPPNKPLRESIQYAFGPALYSSNNYPAILLFNCPIYSVRIEANIVCENAQCAVKRIRRSQVDRRPSEINGWNAEYGLSGGFLSALLEILTTATGTASSTYGTPIDYYLAGKFSLRMPFKASSPFLVIHPRYYFIGPMDSQLTSTLQVIRMYSLQADHHNSLPKALPMKIFLLA